MPEGAQEQQIRRRFGVFELDPRSGELRKQGIRLRLSGQAFQVLTLLVERAGQVVTREELHSQLWPSDTFVDFDHGLNNAVARIREVLEDSRTTPRYVETLPRRGYRFIAAATSIEPLAEGPASGKAAENPEAAPAGSSLPAAEPFSKLRRKFLILAAVGMAVLAGLIAYRVAATHGNSGVESLAVLPLKNLSGDPAQEYLADGMTEELIGRLAGIHHLRVISRTSVMRFKQTTLSAPEIASLLHVDALVEGSVTRQGNRIRVHAQLIRAATDDHFWSETYDREAGDVLSLQSEIALGIADKVRVTLGGHEQRRLAVSRRVSPEAYESFLKGEFGEHNSRPQIDQSVRYLQDAIAKDPEFAPAYVGLAKLYLELSTIVMGAPPSEMRPKVLQAAQKAIEIDPDLAEAHAIVASVYQRRWQWSMAESEYARALQLKPNDAAARLGFADWLVCRGRTAEAVDWALPARDLDPLGEARAGVADVLFFARRYDEAVRELRIVLAIHPDSALAHWSLGRMLLGKGDVQAAVSELERTAVMMQRSPGSLEMLATAYARLGRRREALALLGELKQRQGSGYIPAGAFINPNLALHNYEEAFSWFERAYAEQSNILQFLRVHPFFDPIRGDARFQSLVKRVGLG